MRPWNRIALTALFTQARVDYGTVVWPSEIGIAPETLYDDSESLVSPASCLQFKAILYGARNP